MATQKVLHVGAQIEAQEDLARPRQHGDKAHQRPTGTPDFKVVKVSPVDLHLLTRQGAQAQVSFRFGAWSMASDQVPEVIRSSWVAADPCHVVQATGAQARELLKGLQDERQVRINGRRTAKAAQCRQAGLSEHTRNTVAMHVQLSSDGADAPAFGVVIAQDLRFNFWGEGHAFSDRGGYGESDGAGSPGAPSPARGNGNGSSARAPASPAPTVRMRVDQHRPGVGNPDASLSAIEGSAAPFGPDNAADAWRGRDGHADWLDSGVRPHGPSVGEPHRRIPCSSVGRGRSGCKSVRRCGSQRTDSVFRGGPLVTLANGERQRRPLRDILCMQRRFVAAVGAASELAWRLVPMPCPCFHRQVRYLPHQRR